MQKIASIIILFAVFIEMTFSQDLKLTIERDTSKGSWLFGVKDKKGKTVLPAKYFDIEIDNYGSIIADNRKIFNKNGHQKLTAIEARNLRFNNGLYFNNGQGKIGIYSPQSGKEVYSNFRSEREFCRCPRDDFWNSKSRYYIIHEENRSYLINNRIERLNNIDFKDGFIIEQNFFLIEKFDGSIMLYNENMEPIHQEGEYRYYDSDENYIYLYKDKFYGPLLIYSLKSKEFKKFDKMLDKRSAFLAVEQNDKFLLLKDGAIILETTKIPCNYCNVKITYSNPLMFIYNNKLYRNKILISDKTREVSIISDSMFMAYTDSLSILFYGNNEIYRREGNLGIVRADDIIILHNDKYNSHSIYRDALLFNLNGSMVTDVLYSTLDIIAEDSTFIVSKDNKYGVIDYAGEILLDFNYSHLFKNTKKICPTPFTYFGKFHEEETYQVINLNKEQPVINNIITSYEKNEEKIRYGFDVSPPPTPPIEISKANFEFYKGKGFVDMNGSFHFNDNKNKSYINSEKGTLEFLNINESYSRISTFKQQKHFDSYIAKTEELKNSNLIKLYKLKTTDYKYYEPYNQLRDTAGIINTAGKWVVGPDIYFNYNIINNSFLSKESVLYKLDDTKITPLYSYYSVEFPFIKFVKNDHYRMIDNQGNIIKDSIFNYYKVVGLPQYYFILNTNGKTQVIDNNGNLLFDLKEYKILSGFNLYGFATFISSVDSTYLLVEGDFLNTIKCDKIIDNHYNFLFWDKWQNKLYYDTKKSPISIPAEIINLIVENDANFKFVSLDDKYFMLDLGSSIILLKNDDHTYKHILKETQFRGYKRVENNYFYLYGYDIKAKREVVYGFDLMYPKFVFIK